MRSGPASRALVALVAVAVAIPNHPVGRVPSEDAGVFFYAARTLLAGGTPYLDVWDHKPPLIYFIDALGLLAAGLDGVWRTQVAALVIAAVLSLSALTRAFGRAPATFGTVAWLVAAPRLFLTDGQQTSYVEFYVLPLQFAALALVARTADGRVGLRAAILIGALAGLAILLKPTLIGIWIAIALVALGRERAAAIRTLAGMAAGGTAVIAVALAFFAARGGLGDLIDQALLYNLAYSSFAPLSERLGAIPEGLRLTSPSGLAPLAIAAAVYATVAGRLASPLVAIGVVALPVEMFLATSGRGYHYYFLPWLASFGVLAAFAASEATRRLDARRAFGVLAVGLVAMSIQPARLVARLATTGDDGASRAAAAYIDENTAASDAVLIWGARTEVLVLADRRAPTRDVFQYAPLATRGYAKPAAVDALLGDLTAHPPALIVDASSGSFVTPPLDRDGLRAYVSPEPQYAWPADAVRVIDFVEAGYVRAGTIPGTDWPVWRRR